MLWGLIIRPLPAQPVRNTSVSMFQTFTAGIGVRSRDLCPALLQCHYPPPLPPCLLQGTCDRFQPPAGYWCSTHVQVRGWGRLVRFSLPLPLVPAVQ